MTASEVRTATAFRPSGELTANSTATTAAFRDPAPLLWGVAAACWTAILLLTEFGGTHPAGHHHGLGRTALPSVAGIGAFVLTWTVMVGAMMLPTTVPMSRLVVAVTSRVPHPRRARTVLGVSYLAGWLGFGLAGLAAFLGVQAVVQRWPWLDGNSRLILAATLAGAGAFQFSGLKHRCLTACRDPISMLRHHDERRAGVWWLGFRHGLNCLGCCWALMLLTFGAGAGSLIVMALLTAVMVTENTARWGRRLVTPVGAVLLVAAVAVVLQT
jgi:predicted metal-binding membrane protein